MILSHPALRYGLAAVWLINGLVCKVLGAVPRHEQIVAAILGEAHSLTLTKAIGIGEIGMSLWILSAWRYRWCAVVQIVLIVAMNLIEFFAAPDLLLWGRFNLVFALVLAAVVYLYAFGRSSSPAT